MLDQDNRFTIDQLPYVDIYPDHAVPNRFYLVNTRPRLALDTQGSQQIGLLLYGKKHGVELQMMGGQIIMTISMALTPDEEAVMRRALAERFNPPVPSDDTMVQVNMPVESEKSGDLPGPVIELSSPDWLGGEASISLCVGIGASRKPSLIGANVVVFLLNFDANGAQKLNNAWQDGLPGATITYRLKTTAIHTETASAEKTVQNESASPDGTSVQSEGVVNVTVSSIVELPLTLTGPITLSAETIKNGLRVIRL